MKIVGFIIAVIFAAAVFFLALDFLGEDDANQPIIVSSNSNDVETVSVLVASRTIGLGDVIEAEMLEGKSWPAHLVIDGFVTQGDQSKTVVGRVARSTIMPGEPINLNRLSNPDDPSFIAANLPSGMRMATISSDAVGGLAGFLLPGDRVDVSITHKYTYPEDVAEYIGQKSTEVTETLISNIRVLAVNQRATLVEDENANSRDKLPKSVSLEVTQEQAQLMRLAQEEGYLALTLRSLKDRDSIEEPIVTTMDDVTSIDNQNIFSEQKKDEKVVISLVRGSQKSEIEVPAIQEETPEEEATQNYYE